LLKEVVSASRIQLDKQVLKLRLGDPIGVITQWHNRINPKGQQELQPARTFKPHHRNGMTILDTPHIVVQGLQTRGHPSPGHYTKRFQPSAQAMAEALF